MIGKLCHFCHLPQVVEWAENMKRGTLAEGCPPPFAASSISVYATGDSAKAFEGVELQGMPSTRCPVT